MLQQEQRRNGTPDPRAPKALPNLAPGTLLSAAGRREMKAARELRGMYHHAVMLDDAAHFPQRPTGVVAAVSQAMQMQLQRENDHRARVAASRPMPDIPPLPSEMAQLQALWDFSGDPDQLDPVTHGTRTATAPSAEIDLSSLWASSIPEGAGQLANAFAVEHAGQFPPPPADDFDIEFEGGDIEFNRPGNAGASHSSRRYASANRAGRWVVGREDPPARRRIDSRARAVDGRVVSQRGADGRFRATQSRPAEDLRQGTPVAIGQQLPGQSYRPPDAPRHQGPSWRRGQEPPRVYEDRSTIPTAMERLAGPSPWDD